MKDAQLKLAVDTALIASATTKENLAAALPLFADSSIELNERWANYVALEKSGLLKTRGWGDGYVGDLGDKLCLSSDPFYIERYQTRSYTHLYEISEDEDCPAYKWDEWREKVLKNEVSKGYGSFTYDW